MTLVYILLAILVLEALIFLHELGHYTAGKLLGFRILGFSLGFGPALIKFKKGDTEYALRAIPFGGACQFDGEDEAAEDDPRRFNAQPVWKRLIVIFAGPLMNLITAFIIAFVLHAATPMPVYAVDPATNQQIPVIASVSKDSAAERAGLMADDVLVAVDGVKPTPDENGDIYDAFIAAIGAADDEFTLTVERGGKAEDIVITGAYNAELKKNIIGINISGLVAEYKHLNVIEACSGSWNYLTNIVKLTAQGVAGMFKNGIRQGDVSGVVGTVGIMVSAAKEATVNLVYVAVILSLSLGIFNLIPFPALDGGRLLFLGIEAVIRRPLNRKVEGIVNMVGLGLLFALMIIVTVSDVIGLIKR